MSVEKWIWVLIPIVGLFWVMLATYTKYREKIAMIEKGLKPEEIYPHRPHKPEDILIGGLVVIGIGGAFLLVHFWIGLTKWLTLPGFILLFIGIALVVSHYIVSKPQKRK